MTKNELINMKKAAQRTRIITLNSLKAEDNSAREIQSLMEILELVHHQIMLSSLNLDLLTMVK